MKAFIELVGENALASSLLVAIIVGLSGWAWRARRDRIDRQKIYDFLASSKSESDFTFRSTEAIASHTDLPDDRVAALCPRHPKIKRSGGEKRSWKLIE